MAAHTITIYQSKGGNAKAEKSPKATSASNNISKKGVANKNIPSFSINKQIMNKALSFVGLGGAALTLQYAKKLVNTGVEAFTTINAAATGNEISNNNIKTRANIILNPLSTARDIIIESYLGNLRVQRQNETLNYQRQLTGNLVYSKTFNNGTF